MKPRLAVTIGLALFAGAVVAAADGGAGYRPGQLLKAWDFTGTQLLRARFNKTQFGECSFSDARFSGGTFANTRFSGTEFRSVYLGHCRGQVSLERCEFSSLGLNYVTVKENHWENVLLRGLRVQHSNFQDVYLENCDLRDLHLRNCEVRDLRFENLTISGGLGGLMDWCEWKDTRFYQDDFDDPRFERCEFKSGRFYSCDFTSMRFEYCDLRYCRFEDCDFHGTTIDGVNVEEAIEFYKQHH